METKYVLSVADMVQVKIKGTLNGGPNRPEVNLNFSITMDRLSQEEINAAMSDNTAIADFIVAHAKAWDRQQLVRNPDDGKPAEFSEEALRAMLNIASMPMIIWRAYMRDVGVAEKN